MSDANGPALPQRIPTGITGLDEVLHGGLFRGGVYIAMGPPGVGKTILGNQLAFHHARTGGRVVYATLLSETHGRLLAFLSGMSFFDAALVGDAISYLNGYASLETNGLAGLLQLVREVVRDRRATLLVLDGMLPANKISETEVEYKKFVQQLQTWIELVGCTVVVLSSARETELRPEYTMVDGIFELGHVRAGRRRIRELIVHKLRGSAYLEGAHAYVIDADGLAVYPRIEASVGMRQHTDGGSDASFGRPGLDRLFGGGLVRCSSTLVLGANGSGKTTLGMHFLAAGLDADEPALHVSCYEDPPALLDSARRMGLRFAERLGTGRLAIRWIPAGEMILDRTGSEILTAVRETGARRVVIDGLEAFLRGAFPERLPAFLSALVQELRTRHVTSILTSEVPRLLVDDFETPFPGLSALVDNLVLLLQRDTGEALQRGLAVAKTRGRRHHRGVVPFTIEDTGIEVGPAGAAAGVPRRARRPTGGRRRR